MTWSDISGIFETLERRLISSLKRNLKRHHDWEKSEGFNWSAWQAEKLKNIETYRKENRRIMDEYTDQIDVQTRALMEEQFAEGYEHEEQVLLDSSLPANPSVKSFFGVNNRRMDSLIGDMLNTEARVESAALRMMDDTYRSVVAKTAAEMATGAVTLPQAIDIAMQDFLRAGINCIAYKNGRRVNIADYVQMALRTAATRSYLQGEAKKRAELGIDTVLVSQYGACSETCLPWQGRVYIDDVFGRFDGETDGERGKSKNGNWYQLLSVAVHNGLFHPNCRHTLSTWIEGVSKLPGPMDKSKIREVSALEQKQRNLEKKVREAKRIAAGKLDPDAQKQAKKQVQTRQKELREFIEGHSDVLRRDYWREKSYADASSPLPEVQKSDILQLYKTAGDYKTSNGTFDLDAAKKEFADVVQTMPEPNQTYFLFMGDEGMNPTEFRLTDKPDITFGYHPVKDIIYYNPQANGFDSTKCTAAFAHEQSHRIDALFFQSWEDAAFSQAIQAAEKQMTLDKKDIVQRAKEDDLGCLSDIVSVLSLGEVHGITGHEAVYLVGDDVRKKEVFANLFAITSLQREQDIAWIQHAFPEILTAFWNLIKKGLE